MYVILDTYEAELLNEKPGRREEISEIQNDAGDCELLCYASPERAEFSVRAVNSHDDLLDLLNLCLPYVPHDGDTERDIWDTAVELLSRFHAKATPTP